MVAVKLTPIRHGKRERASAARESKRAVFEDTTYLIVLGQFDDRGLLM
jgi:hypothetical protein